MTVLAGAIMNSDVEQSRRDADVARADIGRRAGRLAAVIDTMCDDGEAVLRIAVAARDEQRVAWLVLCHTGWPNTTLTSPIDPRLTADWLEAWTEYVAMPVQLWSAREMVLQRRILRRLHRCETTLRPELPQRVIDLIDPLDRTGRATLAFVLRALQQWLDATARYDASAQLKQSLRTCASLLQRQAAQLGLSAPMAPLDLSEWRRVADDARALAPAAASRRLFSVARAASLVGQYP
ncbi:MAG: hypothetical protein H7099_15215 [Gemmatimonadaceae bacterium]|nr:hypothetical protein [Gemmatimonadaceae bacterium]